MQHPRQNIHIATRLKPSSSPMPISVQSNLISVSHSSTRKQFIFDQIFQPATTQEQVYESIGFGLVERVVQGFHVTILCYGQTGAGKTYTMYGDPQNYGIVPRVAKHLLDIRDSDQMKFILRVGCVEIYNEQVRDLLDECQKKQIKQSKQGVYVKDMVKTLIKTYDDFRDVLNIVDSLRSTFQTCMNTESSRSHCILTFYLEIVEELGTEQIYKEGRLYCVDLAGSERQKKTNSSGLRLKQANSINKNLVVLRNVIHALIDHKEHVPYRDCKLTRLLKDSFGGGTKTTLIANVSTDLQNIGQTISTLRYAAVVSGVCNSPVIHYDAKDLLIKQYIEEIKKLKLQLEGNDSCKLSDTLKDRLLEERNQITQALEHQQQANQSLKNRIQQLTRAINPSTQLPPTEKRRITQYRRRKLKLLEQKQSILEKSKQQIRNAEIQLQNEFQNENLEGIQVEVLKERYNVLKERYLNLKDELRLIENDFKQEKQLYESKANELQKQNLFLRSIVQRFLSSSQISYIRSSAIYLPTKEFKLPEFKISNNKIQFSNRSASFNSEASDGDANLFNTMVSNPQKVQLRSTKMDEYFSTEKDLFNSAGTENNQKSKSGSKRKKYRLVRSPQTKKANGYSATVGVVSPRPKFASTQFFKTFKSGTNL